MLRSRRGPTIKPFAEAYNADISDLQHELYQAKRMLERLSDASKKDPSAGGVPASLVSFVAYIARYGEALHELHRLGRIAVCLPVSTAACERSFSALRQIKTWVRNSMSDSKLCNLSLLAIERERLHSLSVDAVVDAHKNRRIALLYSTLVADNISYPVPSSQPICVASAFCYFFRAILTMVLLQSTVCKKFFCDFEVTVYCNFCKSRHMCMCNVPMSQCVL